MKNTDLNRLDYNYGNKTIPGTFRISASQISSYFDQIPNGSIEKLIGRKLTWEDEPVELKERIL